MYNVLTCVGDVYSAVRYMKICLTFQLKTDSKSNNGMLFSSIQIMNYIVYGLQ